MLTTITYHQIQQSKKLFNLGLITILIINIGLFSTFKKFESEIKQLEINTDGIKIIDVPITKYEKPKPAPRPPTTLIPMEEIELPTEEYIDAFPIFSELGEAPPEPPALTGDIWNVFVVHDQAPQVIGGYASIAQNLIYPKMAAKLGIQGTVTIRAIIDKNGNVLKTQIYQSMGNEACDLAAQKAVEKTKWIPAKQRDEPVQVVVAIPIEFRLAH